jgi:hypothetical protein
VRVAQRVPLPGQANQDTDGEGMPDWAEVVAGTSPTDPGSVFKAASGIRPASRGGSVIHGPGISDRIVHKAF